MGSSEGGAAPAGGASLARLYDYALGGKDNYAVDRALYERLTAVYPEYRAFATANRSFLVHAVRRMTGAGIRQFLDLGSGLPTEPNVHGTAREDIPGAAVVYLDQDPVAVAHCRARLGGTPGVHAVQHDLRDVDAVLADPAVRGALDLDRPVGLLCVAVLHFIEQAEARRVLAAYREALAPGSWIAVSAHTLDPARDRPAMHAEGAGIAGALGTTIVARRDAEVDELLTGFTVVDPGVVDLAHWRPHGSTGARLWCASALGRLDRAAGDGDPRIGG